MHISRQQRYLALLTLILLAGALFRMVNLDALDLWVDEGFTLFVTQHDDFMEALIKDVHPPGYFGMVTLWTKLAGYSEFSLRYPSFLLSMLNISLMVLLAREIQRLRPRPLNPAVPLFAGLVLILADMDIYIAQEARTYSLLIFGGLVSTWAMLRWWRTGRWQYALLWTLSAAGMVYTHYLGTWTPIAQGVFVLLCLRGRQRIAGMGLLVLAAALVLPWILLVILPYQVDTFSINVSADPSTLETLWQYRISYLSGQWALLGGLALLGLVAIRQQNDETVIRLRPATATILLLLWFSIPLALTYILNMRSQLLLFDYRITQIMPPLLLLIAFGLGNLKRQAVLFILPVMIVYGVTEVNVYRPKPPWSDYAREMLADVQPGDGVVVDFGGGDYQLMYYLAQMLPPDVEAVSMRQWSYWEPETYEPGILGFMSDHEVIWLLRWNDNPEGFIKLDFAGHTQTAATRIEHPGADLWRYRFEQVPDSPRVLYKNGIQLMRATVRDDLTLDLLWTTDSTLTTDYVISGLWLDESGVPVAQIDSPPAGGARPTTTWQPGEVIHESRQPELLRDSLPPGRYQAAVVIYSVQADGNFQRVENIQGDDVTLLDSITLPE